MTVPRPSTCAICAAPLTAFEAQRGLLCGRVECEWKYRALPKSHVCAECGRPLAVAQRVDGVCAGACRERQVTRQRRDFLRRQRGAFQEEARTLHARGASALGVDPDAYPLTVIPSQSWRLTRLPKRRRRDFRARLVRLIAGAVARRSAPGTGDAAAPVHDADGPPPPPAPLPPLEPLPAEVATVLGAACGHCRGFCCGWGGDHAYLTVETMAHWLDTHPGQGADDALAAYLAHLEGVTYRRSCVYHGPTGCALPRDMRSDTCNRYFCDPLRELRDRVAAGDEPRAFFAALEEGGIRSGAFVDVREVRVVRRAR